MTSSRQCVSYTYGFSIKLNSRFAGTTSGLLPLNYCNNWRRSYCFSIRERGHTASIFSREENDKTRSTAIPPNVPFFISYIFPFFNRLRTLRFEITRPFVERRRSSATTSPRGGETSWMMTCAEFDCEFLAARIGASLSPRISDNTGPL